MELYTGIDIVDIDRFRKTAERYGNRFLKRIFTEKELSTMPAGAKNLFLSISFSFKESVWKSLPETIQQDFHFRDIEVLWKRKNPVIALKGRTNVHDLALHFFTVGRSVVTTAFFFEE